MATYNKPKLKIVYQTKNKVYLNKNSKFRFFYLIRNKFFKSRENTHRRFLCLRNMKWTIARRFFCSRPKNRQNLRFSYLTKLQNKQQLKRFYGNLREEKLIKLLKSAWTTKSQHKQVIFLQNLESRLSILLLRMRVLPTIFACNQFILHQGVYVNNEKIYLPNYQINEGDIISFDKKVWNIFYKRLNNKVVNRYNGSIILLKRNIRKKQIIKRKLKSYKRNRKRDNLIFIGDVNRFEKQLTQIKKLIYNKKFLIKMNKNNNTQLIFKLTNYLKLIEIKINKLKNSLYALRKWKKSIYYKGEVYVIINYVFIEYLFKKLNQFILKCFFNKNYTINYDKYLNSLIDRVLSGTYVSVNKKFLYKNKYYKNVINRQNFNSWWYKQPHWYIPSNVEIDYTTLRLSLIGKPKLNDVSYPFSCSLHKIISFYTDKGYK